MQEAEIAAGEFVITRKDMSKMLDLVDEAFHQMTLTIQPDIIRAWLLAALVRRNDWLCASLKNNVDKVLTCIASVCDDIVRGKACAHLKRLGAVMALACAQAHTQGIAQTIDCHMYLRAEPASAPSQRLVSLPACFFVRLPRRDEHALSYCQSGCFPCRGLGQNTQTSLAIFLPRTNARSVYRRCSSSHKRLAAIATVPRFAASIAPLRQSVGIFALTLSRCLYISGETARFYSIVHQLVVSSCGYYATNVNTS